MDKLKKATKRISAVAASAVMVGSAVFGAGLSNYPSNFVSGGEFDGQVVVGSAAAASDTTAANSIIDDLASEFSGDNEKVKITYKSSSSGGDTVNAVKSTSQLNYGETLGSVSESSGFDDGDTDMLQDEDLDNGYSDEEYEQTLTLNGGTFNFALRDEVEGVDTIANGIFYSNDDTFATYVLDLKNVINLSDSGVDLDDDFVGQTMVIMGNEFTIGSITKSSNGELNKLELIGGSNKVSLGEGESTTVSVDGKSYEVAIQSVSSTEVLMTVNGESASIDEYDTEDVAGVSVAVTELVDSDRDSVKGYAEIVVGGQKVTLDGGSGSKLIKINDEDVDDLYDGYEVYADFSDAGSMDTITITYKVSDDTLLQAGDSLKDVLFDAFELVFEGTNSPDYETLKLTVQDDDINIEGTLINGNEFDMDLVHAADSNGPIYLKGDQDADRIFIKDSLSMSIREDGSNGITAYNSTHGTSFGTGFDTTISSLGIDFSATGIDGSGLLLYDDADEQYLYEIDSVDTNDNEIDVAEHLDDKGKDELTPAKLLTDLEVTLTGNTTTTAANVSLSGLAGSSIGFANELMLDLSSVEASLLGTSTGGNFTFSLDTGDVDEDTTNDDNENYEVRLSWDSTDTEFDLSVPNDADSFENNGNEDNEDGNTDVKTYVTRYGTMIEFDNDESTWVEIRVPEEQVYAKVNLIFGGDGASVMTTTVDADMVDATKADLEDDGYTIVSTESVTQETVEFDVSAPVMDSDVSGMDDMIVVGGPAVNTVAAALLGMSYPTMGTASGVNMGEAVIRYFEASNSVLVYGYDAADTTAAANKLNSGGLSGSLVNVN